MLHLDVPLYSLALLLGVKHAYDADHLVAVSTYIVKSRSMAQTLKMSLSWAVGHMATAGIITLLLFRYKDFFFSTLLSYFENIVGVMLIVLGVISILNSKGMELIHHHDHDNEKKGHAHSHIHSEDGPHEHYHKHMFGIGIIHGLASNDELIILFTASLGVSTLFSLITYVAIYSIGVVAGMTVFGYVISYSFLKTKKEQVTRYGMAFFGLISVLYGILILREGLLF